MSKAVARSPPRVSSSAVRRATRPAVPVWLANTTGTEVAPAENNHGFGSSLSQAGDLLFVQVAHAGPSYLVAFGKRDGKERWRAARPSGGSWTTPLFVPSQDGVVYVSSGRVEAYAARDGRRLWSAEGQEGTAIPSPFLADGRIVVASSKKGMTRAYRAETGQIAWQTDEATTDYASPLIEDGIVFLTNKVGVLYALDLESGALLWTTRLPGACWASSLAVRSHLCFFGVDGRTTVLKATRRGLEPLGESSLAISGRVYGVAAVDGALLVRTGGQLIRIKPCAAVRRAGA
jgi:outer membrane protein assembly factor BamB